jgi:two-component system, sensor histidine kinase and response regulator
MVVAKPSQGSSKRKPRTAGKGIGVVDLDAALRRMGGDRELLAMLIRMFLEDAPGLVKNIETSAQAAQWSETHRVAHCLRGLAANLNAQAVMNAAGEIEEETAAAPPGELQTAIASLQSAVERVRAELRKERN